MSKLMDKFDQIVKFDKDPKPMIGCKIKHVHVNHGVMRGVVVERLKYEYGKEVLEKVERKEVEHLGNQVWREIA
jgi:hypothetical protein